MIFDNDVCWEPPAGVPSENKCDLTYVLQSNAPQKDIKLPECAIADSLSAVLYLFETG